MNLKPVTVTPPPPSPRVSRLVEAIYGGAFAKMDADRNGAVTRDEFVPAHGTDFKSRDHARRMGEVFDRYDANGNGSLSREEYLQGVYDSQRTRAARVARPWQGLADRIRSWF